MHAYVRGTRFPLCHELAKEKWRHNHGFCDFNFYREYHLKTNAVLDDKFDLTEHEKFVILVAI
jgi:hypothetical protein